MAKRYALVPETWLQEQVKTSNKQTIQPVTSVYESTTENQNDSDIIDLLPKAYKAKAKTILHYLKGYLKLDNQHRVRYEDNNQLGSHIIDLLRYFAAPFPTERPIDAPQFFELIKEAGVPSSAVAKRHNSQVLKPAAQWREIK